MIHILDVQEKGVGVGEKRRRSSVHKSGLEGCRMTLPLWFSRSYTCNTTMPSLVHCRNNLRDVFGWEEVQVGHFAGVYCPAQLCENKLHIHHSNGVYIALKVIIYMCVITKFILVY